MANPKASRTILCVDDERLFCDAVSSHFAGNATEVLSVGTGAECLAICSQKKIDVVLLDQKLPDVEGHTLCGRILELNDQTKIIFMTAHPSFENVLIAIRCGAYDYLSKPFELEELGMAIEKAFRTIELEKVEEIQDYKTRREREEVMLIGGGGGLAETERLIDLAAGVDSPVLITGETGTGKNLAAMAIHYRSPLQGTPFVSLNCAALPENLIETELFGHEKGAFTGAVATRKGIFEVAGGGTLFLDEIGEIPFHLQSKLLSVLEEKKLRRLGGESEKQVKVRVIASTSIPIEQALGKTFRKDLYYRLSVVRIHLPPLRERKQDIPELCDYLLKTMAGGAEVTIPDDEVARLMEYDWPGNVRELKNIIERTFILQKGPLLRPSELLTVSPAPGIPGSAEAHRYNHCLPSSSIMTLLEVEKDYIRFALERLSNNYTQTAKALGISLSTLKRKLKEYGLK